MYNFDLNNLNMIRGLLKACHLRCVYFHSPLKAHLNGFKICSTFAQQELNGFWANAVQTVSINRLSLVMGRARKREDWAEWGERKSNVHFNMISSPN